MLDIPGIAYFKKNTWCGSHKQQRCRIAVVDDNFVVSIWNEPYSFEATSDENKTHFNFNYSIDGLEKASDFLREKML